MNRGYIRRRLRTCLALCVTASGLIGCSGYTGLGIGPTYVPASFEIGERTRIHRTRDAQEDQVKPQHRRPRYTPEYDERHPSRWKKKLRAKYA